METGSGKAGKTVQATFGRPPTPPGRGAGFGINRQGQRMGWGVTSAARGAPSGCSPRNAAAEALGSRLETGHRHSSVSL